MRLEQGGGNIRPAGHIRPSKAKYLCFDLDYLTKIWPERHTYNHIWPALHKLPTLEVELGLAENSTDMPCKSGQKNVIVYI